MTVKQREGSEWTTILDEIQASVDAALGQTPEPDAPDPPPESAEPGRAGLDALERRVADMQASLERAERCVRETDASLQAEADLMERWNCAVREVRERLATR